MKNVANSVLAIGLALLLPMIAAAQLVTTVSGTGESLTIVLAGAKATTDATYAATYGGSGEPVSVIGTTNGVAAVTVLSGVASVPRQIHSFMLYNADTAAITATINKVSASTTYPLQKITLPVGATLRWSGSETRVMDSSGQLLQTVTDTSTVGAVAGTGSAVAERVNGVIHQTTITLNALPVSLTDANNGGGTKIYDFPEGRVLILGTTGTSKITTTSAIASTLNSGVTCNWGLGTVQTTTQNSGTLATTQQDLLPTTNITSSTTINVEAAASSGALVASAQFDGTTTHKAAYWNLGVATNTDIDADATITVNGTLVISWVFLGDY